MQFWNIVYISILAWDRDRDRAVGRIYSRDPVAFIEDDSDIPAWTYISIGILS